MCGCRGPRNNPLLLRQSVSTETETDQTRLNSLICQCFIQIYIELNCFFIFTGESQDSQELLAPMAGKVLCDCHTNACSIMFSFNTRI